MEMLPFPMRYSMSPPIVDKTLCHTVSANGWTTEIAGTELFCATPSETHNIAQPGVSVSSSSRRTCNLAVAGTVELDRLNEKA